jgi:LysM repeat protein
VKPGEDIFDIAFEFGVTVAQIKQWNGLTSNSVQQGKVIVIVKSAPIGPRR